jgi:hypothetical protein
MGRVMKIWLAALAMALLAWFQIRSSHAGSITSGPSNQGTMEHTGASQSNLERLEQEERMKSRKFIYRRIKPDGTVVESDSLDEKPQDEKAELQPAASPGIVVQPE